MKYNKSVVNKLILALLAYLPVFAINAYFDNNTVLLRNSILNLFLYVSMFFLLEKTRSIPDGYLHKCALFAAVFSAIALTFGHSLYVGNNFDLILGSLNAFFESLLQMCGLVVFFYCVFKIVFHYLIKLDANHLHTKQPEKGIWKYFGANVQSLLIVWLIIFLCWLPCYLSYYPGIFSYDMDRQIYQAVGEVALDRFHNTAHTFFLMLTFNVGRLIGDYVTGLIVYSIAQMLIVSFAFSVVVWYMAKIGVHRGLRITALAYFALNPLNALFSFTPTKDVLFSAFFVLSTVILVDVVKNPERFFTSVLRRLSLCIMLVVTCLFRQNAIYGMFIFFPLFMLLFKRHKRYVLRIVPLFLITVITYLLIYGPLYNLLGVEPGAGRETMSVPISQIAYVVSLHEDELTLDEREAIDEIIGIEEIKEYYNPRFVDPLKRRIHYSNFSENPSKYISLWLSLFLKYPKEYLEAGLNLNLGYWYPDCVHPDQYSERIYIETQIWDIDLFKIERKSVFLGLYESYQKFAWGVEQQKIPVVSMLFSIGFPIWFAFFFIMMCIVKRRRKLILIILPAVCVWLTYMAGPVSNMRYIYFIIACYPLYFSMAIHSSALDSKREEISSGSEMPAGIQQGSIYE